jgi:hypothetical protein
MESYYKADDELVNRLRTSSDQLEQDQVFYKRAIKIQNDYGTKPTSNIQFFEGDQIQ